MNPSFFFFDNVIVTSDFANQKLIKYSFKTNFQPSPSAQPLTKYKVICNLVQFGSKMHNTDHAQVENMGKSE